MRQRKFDEILEECISAYLDGRRRVEESLGLYPSLARRLGPLLRAAADTADSFRNLNPRAGASERIRRRILRAACERAAARSLTSQIRGFGPRRGPPLRWGLIATIIGSTTALAAISGPVAFEIMDGRQTDGEGSVAASSPALSSRILTARQRIHEMREKARSGQSIDAADLAALVNTTRDLTSVADPTRLNARDAEDLQQIVAEQMMLLQEISSASPAENYAVETALALTRQLAASLGIPLDGSTLDPTTATPAATEPSTITEAGGQPAPSPTQTPTTEATEPPIR
jgi:hypothetical protein